MEVMIPAMAIGLSGILDATGVTCLTMWDQIQTILSLKLRYICTIRAHIRGIVT